MNQNLRVADLDFDTIKANLKEYLSTQPGFTDYDYEGSSLSVMLDVLAYNTHYNAVIANMMVQEMFLDTAVKRETVSLHAKRMGYLPRSMRAARAFVSMEVFPQNTPATLTLGKNAVFNNSGAVTFNFFTRDAITITPDSEGRYIFPEIPLFEGTPTTFRYVVTDTSAKFTIPTANVDTSLLRVYVQKSIANTDRTVYQYFDNITHLDNESQVYYLRTNEKNLYDVYFGDGVLGKEIEVGNVIILEYAVCSGEIPNGAGGFKFNDSVNGYTSLSVTTTNKAFGGAQQESIAAIKENAYKRMLSQNRAVSETDYKAIINGIVPIGDAAVWGGESNNPPVYGKVFISLIPIDVNAGFDAATKQYILDNLKSKMMVTVTPEIVDPDFTYVDITTTAYFDPNATANTADQIKTLVFNNITSYVDQNLNAFGKQLKHSNFTHMVDLSDRSVTSNITKFAIKKKFTPVLNTNTSYVIKFNNPLRESSEVVQYINSGAFYVGDSTTAVYIDDLAGNIRLYNLVSGVKNVLRNIGTIDYASGTIRIDPIVITGYPSSEIFIRVVPLSNDIISVNNSVLVVNDADIMVNAIAEPRNKSNYVFTAS